MSYDVALCDPVTGKTLELDSPHQMRGGTYCVGGTTLCELNITFNYTGIHRRAFGNDRGVETIYGTTGAESLPLLETAIANLGDDVSDDYWEATEGNAKRALLHLAALAKLRPDGVWKGD